MNAAKPPAKKKVAIPQLTSSEARPAPVVLMSGPESFLAERATQQIRAQLREQDDALEVSDIEAESYTSGELFTLASPSLFGEPRLLRVSGVEKCTDAFLADTLAYLESPAEDTTLILRHSSGVRGKALLDAVRGGKVDAVEIVCAEVKKDADRMAFVTAEFRRFGAQAAPQAIRALCAAVPGDLAELSASVQQLVADGGSKITQETVDRYFGGRVEAGAFKIADVALAGHTAEALVLLRHAFANGDEPIPLLAAINSKLRGIARVYGAKGSASHLASSLGMAPWMVERALTDSRKWRESDLARCIELAASTEWQLKGGSRDPEFALEQLVTTISRHGRTG